MIADLDITAIAAGGAGVARHEGLVVFVPRTAPGDRVRAEIVPKGRFAQGRLREVTRASPKRIRPPCTHYERDRCGGCQLQHLTYDAQREAKGLIVRDALLRIGNRGVEVPYVHASPREWRYRNKLTLALRRSGETWIAGLHPYDAPGRIFPLEECPITEDAVVALWHAIMAASRWLPHESELRGAVRISDAGTSFVLEGGRRWAHHAQFFAAVSELGTLWWIPRGEERRLMQSRGDFGPTPAFAQVNPGVADKLRDYVIERVMAHRPASVIEAYAGEGELAVALHARGVEVTTIEIDGESVERTRASLPAGTRVMKGRVEEQLHSALPADAVILNPPRNGLHQRVTDLLSTALLGGESRPHPASRAPHPALFYISCDAATLSRDLRRLPNYQIASLVAFDMFPQTAHVETVCELVPGQGI
ncbi:MAG: class I SAM-dependent RNA methyltransferase [Gemmatimonadaceae bacterium]